jgi:hypothetical protein
MEEVFSVQSLHKFNSPEYSVISLLIRRRPVVMEQVGELSSSQTFTWGFCHWGYSAEFINSEHFQGKYATLTSLSYYIIRTKCYKISSFPNNADKHLSVLVYETVKILYTISSKISSSIY